jgi:hypothetical protein
MRRMTRRMTLLGLMREGEQLISKAKILMKCRSFADAVP